MTTTTITYTPGPEFKFNGSRYSSESSWEEEDQVVLGSPVTRVDPDGATKVMDHEVGFFICAIETIEQA